MSVRALLGVSFSAFLYPVDQFLLGRERIIHGLYRCAEAGFFGLVQFGDAAEDFDTETELLLDDFLVAWNNTALCKIGRAHV